MKSKSVASLLCVALLSCLVGHAFGAEVVKAYTTME